MIDGGLCLEARAVAWLARYAWGNDLDHAVEKPGGRALGQKDFATSVGISKQRASETFAEIEAHGFMVSLGTTCALRIT